AEFRAGVLGDAVSCGSVAQPRPGAGAGDRLRAALFDPLAVALGPCKRVLLAPDGDLNRLPFEVLPLADGRCLIDEYRISDVSVGRDLLRFQVRSGRQPGDPVVAADPDFDLRSQVEPARPEQPAGGKPAAPAGRRSRDLDRGRFHFPRLPGTRAEG